MPTFKVLRYDPKSGKQAYFQSYQLPAIKGMTVLEGLYYILENLDSTLAFRSSCRQGVCGSCAMHIGDQYRLACETQASAIGDTVVIRPLAHMKIIRDLVVDLDPFFRQYASIKPYLIPASEPPAREIKQSPKERAKIDPNVDCILCAACYGSCPVVATDEKYLGPQALLAALRYVADSRDGASGERLAYLATDYGIFRCHTIFNCQQVCPKKLDPTAAIAKLKMKALWAKFTGKMRIAE
jgi:succinate dehydrogenase / fumarate reductase iron-sulfur subunit